MTHARCVLCFVCALCFVSCWSVAGELVTGNIVCEAVAPLMAQGIDLKVSGYEKTEWHDQQHRTETITPAIPGVNGQPGTPAVTRQIPQMHRHRGKKQVGATNGTRGALLALLWGNTR